jgi:alkylhydroperoxidase family enzyme
LRNARASAWRESKLYSTRERAALSWTEALTNIRDTHAPDEVFEEAQRHFSEKEVADLSIAIAMINAWNRLSIGSRIVHPLMSPRRIERQPCLARRRGSRTDIAL